MKASLATLVTITLLFLSAERAQSQHLPEPGDWTFEIGIIPLGDQPVEFSHFRLRTFRSNDIAYRLGANFRMTSEELPNDERETHIDFLVAPGIEKHFYRGERVSAYYGGEIAVRYRSASEQLDAALNAVAGVDVHFLSRLYAGVEVGYGFHFNNDGDFGLGTLVYPAYRLGIRL